MYPLVSVIVAVYNVGPYLKCCLDSIVNQTYNNLEILVVTSPSNDDSEIIAEEYESVDKRVQVIHRPKLGLSDARNAGISESHGEYLVFIDGDDYISEYYIEHLLHLMEKGCDIAQCGFKEVDSSSSSVNNIFSHDYAIYTNIEASSNLLNQSNTANIVTWSKMYARNLFSSITFPIGKIHEDAATTYKLLYLSKKIAVTKDILYYYRQTPGSIMNCANSGKKISFWTDFWEFRLECIQFYEKMGEAYLHARALCVFLKWVGSAYHDLQTYVPHSSDIQKKLISQGREYLKIALKEKDISIAEKGLFVMICYCPWLVSVLVGWRRKISHLPICK